ncbi:MAG: TonB-dependent receptor [Sulfurospirillaceae bacterium]|nr:TonB-dependent receptor [Sulfurospirillaceae bacterium]MDD2825696.1 TonB-dependent receptor [Sulfurospirillaceae bacterium]
MVKYYSIPALLLLLPLSLIAENVQLDSISVTATKIATGTKEVSQSIAVVNAQSIEDKNVLDVSSALENIPGVNVESSSNSPSPRLIIRGAGLKASYGVREIMVIKDGVPMTDPDSFTRFDYIDMQDVQSIEVQKGPGSINAVNTTGGVIQLITKSVFDEDSNSIKVGLGNDGQRNLNLKLRSKIDDNDFASMTFSKRTIDNDWRDNNAFDSTQVSFKYGHIFDDDATLESELAYTESNLKLPASMTKEEFEIFKSTGEQHNTSSPWQYTARDSKILSFNSKYEKEVGAWTYKPRFYINKWEHFHPVTGIINDADQNYVYGVDLETDYAHKFFDREATLVMGVTAKQDRSDDAKKYQYADVITSGTGRILQTLSNTKGSLANTEDSRATLYGVYAMETFSPFDKTTIDISSRIDKLNFDISGNEISYFNYSTGKYATGEGDYAIDKSYTLLSSKLGITYALTDTTNIYTSVAFANQAPTTSELGDNENLDKTKSINYEVGLKTRTENFSYDMAIYQNDVKDEIIQIKDAGGTTIYDNAGETQKRGFEFLGTYAVNRALSFGLSYAYSDFKYKSFQEKVGAAFVSRDGNYLPYIPKHQYGLEANYKMDNGFKARIQTKSWGSYYLDNANSDKYEGYEFVTDLMLGYEFKEHLIQLNIYNIFDKHYAMQADKSVYGVESYKAAAPRSAMVSYRYKF